jgi:hypothetical protein
MIFRQHLDGINRSRLGRRERIGAATLERYFQRGLQRQFGEWNSRADQTLRLASDLIGHPVSETIDRFKQRLCYLLLKKHRTRKQGDSLVPVRQAGLAPLLELGNTPPSGRKKSKPCDGSLVTTDSLKGSATKWSSSSGTPMASATSKTTGLE